MDSKLVMRIEIATHYFKVLNPAPRAIPCILRFCGRYSLYKWVRNRQGKGAYQVDKVFACRTRNNREFRFHIGQFKDFITYLDKDFITPDMYDVSYKEFYTPSAIMVAMRDGWVLRDYQQKAHDFSVEDAEEDNRSRLIAMPTGMGKSQPLYSLIRIPNGWCKMSNISIGDEVIAKDGSITRVNGIFPQGYQDTYRITFIDGRSTDCSIDHLWKVYNSDWTTGSKIIETHEIIRLLETSRSSLSLYIDLPDPEITSDIKLPIDPYVLGVILGDGMISDRSVLVCNPEDFIINEVSTLIPEDLEIVKYRECRYSISNKVKGRNYNPILTNLRDLKLQGTFSHTKFIPDVYLNGSIDQRLALLQGLLDTDGSVNGGHISYCTTSKQLAAGVQYLVRSLGGLVKIKLIMKPKFKYKGEIKTGKPAYILYIRYREPSSLFRLPRKKDKVPVEGRNSNCLKLRISSIEYIGSELSQCIAIDHPERLYITDDFIVTHNTTTALSISAASNYRTLICILPTYIEQWAKAINQILTVDNKEITIIQGSNSLKGLIDQGIEGSISSKFILVSLRTIQNFFKTYEECPEALEEEGYNCLPEDLCKVLGIGTVIIDETHQHLHAVYKFLTYTHVHKVIALSATLLSDDQVITDIQHMMFPKEIRFDEIKMEKYIRCYSVSYGFDDLRNSRIRISEYGSNNYSHVAFEKSLMRNHKVLRNYVNMIDYLVQLGYLEEYQPKDKLIIFVSTVAMCEYVTNYFKQKYPHLDVRRYVEQDPFENVIEADIRITTVLSAGTAVDIPDLTTAIQTINIKSSQSNIQTMGRLRKIKDRSVRFYYLYCYEIAKHHEYHKHRMEIYQDRVASLKEFKYPLAI